MKRLVSKGTVGLCHEDVPREIKFSGSKIGVLLDLRK